MNDKVITAEEQFVMDLEESDLEDELEQGKDKPADTEEDDFADSGEADDTAAEVDHPAKVEETKAEVAAAEEFFPGYADLADEAKAWVRGQKEKADQAEEFRAAAARSEADRRATVGKLAPLQKAHQELLDKQKVAKVEQTDSSKAAAKAALEKFQKEYPDEAEALLAVNSQFESFAERTERENAELREYITSLDKRVSARDEKYEQVEARNRDIAILEKLHPDRAEINESEEWAAWVEAVDPYKIQLLKSRDPVATAAVITDFKRDRELARLLSGQPATPNTPAPKKPLARTVADPRPTSRRTTVPARSTSAAMSEGEQRYLDDLASSEIDDD
jgi:hypothetical protein